jgi:acetyl-CoA carboxylase biotin carboxyl carrier protein
VPEEKIVYSLTFADVIRILRLVDAAPFRNLEFELEGLKLRVVQDKDPAQSVSTPAHTEAPSKATPTAQASKQPARPQQTRQAASDEETLVLAPLAGTFYRAPSPDAAPYVEVGTAVREGDVVGILEIMKLMNHVTAPCSGIVREICVRNEEFVEFGQLLAVIGTGEGR